VSTQLRTKGSSWLFSSVCVCVCVCMCLSGPWLYISFCICIWLTSYLPVFLLLFSSLSMPLLFLFFWLFLTLQMRMIVSFWSANCELIHWLSSGSVDATTTSAHPRGHVTFHATLKESQMDHRLTHTQTHTHIHSHLHTYIWSTVLPIYYRLWLKLQEFLCNPLTFTSMWNGDLINGVSTINCYSNIIVYRYYYWWSDGQYVYMYNNWK